MSIGNSRYAKIMYNDITDGEGTCVSLWMQGCPFKCKNCHNKITWSPALGKPATEDTILEIINSLRKNGIHRNFSILGGEPLVEYNREFVLEAIKAVKNTYPETKIFLWTGYTIEELKELNNTTINSILDLIDVLIDGRYEDDKRDITLHLRGSSNQRILNKGIDF